MTRRMHFALVATAAIGCARLPAPADPSSRALFRDLERQVTVTATTGWSSDKLEIDGMMKSTLDSVCRVEPLARRELGQWLDAEVSRLGGPVEFVWRQRGKDLDRVDRLVVVTRIKLLLARSEELANDCPFWLEPEHPFRGRQISEQRWQLTFGGGGKAIAVKQGDRTDLSFGGAGRLLFGRSLSDGHTFLSGVELGASAAFPKDDSGTRSGLIIGIDLVTPLVYRRTFTNTYLELEGGYLARANEQDWNDLDHGVHAALAFGARTLRTRFVFPGAAFGISYERTFGNDVTLIKLGGRVTFDLDF